MFPCGRYRHKIQGTEQLRLSVSKRRVIDTQSGIDNQVIDNHSCRVWLGTWHLRFFGSYRSQQYNTDSRINTIINLRSWQRKPLRLLAGVTAKPTRCLSVGTAGYALAEEHCGAVYCQWRTCAPQAVPAAGAGTSPSRRAFQRLLVASAGGALVRHKHQPITSFSGAHPGCMMMLWRCRAWQGAGHRASCTRASNRQH